MPKNRTLSAQEAADQLGISKATLYAYVSRGMIRSAEGDPTTRERRYHAEDVEALATRKTYRRDPAKAVGDALHWGTPMLESSLTLIHEGRLFYRGQPVDLLAREQPFERVAALLWDDEDTALNFVSAPLDLWANPLIGRDLPISARMAVVLAVAGAHDLGAYDLTPAAVRRTGARIVGLLTAAATESWVAPEHGIAEKIASAWAVSAAAPLINAALILCADHELNASSFAARVVASAEATPYAVVAGGLAALTGFKHGGNTERVEAFLRESPDLPKAAADRLRRGEYIPGFGHRLYPDGDPRAVILLEMLHAYAPNAPLLAQIEGLLAVMADAQSTTPTIDLALAALAHSLNLPAGAPLALFAIGRSVGWIAHALEQYADDDLIRPRARYVGRMPV